LQTGDIITMEDLMHGMLIASLSDCALVVGRILEEDYYMTDFVTLMGTRAAELGMTDTVFDRGAQRKARPGMLLRSWNLQRLSRCCTKL
jgi:hypothetical protein